MRPCRQILKAVSLIFLVALFFFPVHAHAGKTADVTGVKHWSNPNYTRIVISLDKKTEFSHKLLNPDPAINKDWRRLYVDIKGAELGAGLDKSIPINDGLLKVARAGQFDKDTVRVVFDIESIDDFKIFPLSDPFRIVVDVTGKGDSVAKAEEALPKEPQKPQPVIEKPFSKRTPEIRSASPSITQQLGLKVRKIVLDPGHGGKDPGAIGRGGLKEKDVTLKLGRMLKESLASKLDSMIVMTRNSDVFIPLEERTAIANSQDADLFVSIHINASPRRAASGVETYTLGLSNSEEAKRIAARENATSTRSVSDLEFILNDLIKTAKTNDSVRLAASVQDKLVAGLRAKYKSTKSNGVKGAPFYVLVGTKMPAILIEVSYISNPEEEKRLKDERYLKEIVDGITSGLIKYINGEGQSV
ncbi:MAG: N-acetylmuramoyl-L-alanine amidase [Deltaproteobacteria bacterium]|nr:N-acetylmuramoyl-L-alanine amidase [Deltaproteobacteria bacterium]